MTPIISLHQPWPALIAMGVKVHETRGKPAPVKYIGRRIGIHAAQRPVNIHIVHRFLRDRLAEHYTTDWPNILARGALILTAVIDGSYRTEARQPASDNDRLAGDWSPGRYAWALSDVRVLVAPLQMKGSQGWWSADLTGLHYR